jgi:amino acid permease
MNIWCTYASLKEKTNESAMKSICGAISLTFLIYLIVSFIAIYMFGSAIQSDILQNVGLEGGTWEAYVLRVAFIIVVACHIPFIFFAGKESFLIIIEELTRKLVSKTLEAQL